MLEKWDFLVRFLYISDCEKISKEDIYVNVVIKTINKGQLWGRGMTAGGVTPPAVTATADSFCLMTTFT